MKKLLVFLLAISIIFPASADVRFKDIPKDHWAASAVYDLVRLGVTKGYPDGTFRGTKTITRYEIAIFLSKLAEAIGAKDIQADIRSLKEEIKGLKEKPVIPPLTGSYSTSWKVGNLLSTSGAARGTVGSYRLILGTTQQLAEGAKLKITLDTMDYGYFDDGSISTAGRGLVATELLEIESALKLDLSPLGLENPVELKVTSGPGPKQHAADPTGSLSSEVGVTYLRPRPTILASTQLGEVKISGGYIARGKTYSGRVEVSQLTGSIGYTFSSFPLVNNLKIEITGDYLSRGLLSATDRDLRTKINFSAPLGEKIMALGTLGFAGRKAEDMMASTTLNINDLWNSGTVAMIKVNRIGSQYITPALATELFDEAGYDTLMRPLVGGTWNIGGEITQAVSDNLKLIGRGDVRLSSDLKYEGTAIGRLTAQGGVLYNVAPSVALDAAYRINQDKATGDTSDVAALGLQYKF